MALTLLSLLVVAYSIATTFALALPDTCSEVERLHPNITVGRPDWTFASDYAVSQREYWNKAAGDQKTTCIIYPKNAQDVSNILRVLHGNHEHFAVKGGGHMPNKEFNGVNGGPLIALERMNTLKYDMDTQTLDVGPGNRWHDVANHMDKYGRVVVSGRIGHVGVPGLLLGGGLSFLSTEYGWASTHVLEYEIVLPNGTITTASRDNNPDLHRALRASGGIMGVVTRFKLATYPIGKIWGGYRFYSASQTSKMLETIRDFTEYYPDPKAGIIATSETTLYGALGLWTVFFFYNGPDVPEHVFANFSRIPHVASYTKTQSFRDLVYDNNRFSINGSYYAIGTETVPLPPAEHGKEVMTDLFMTWRNISSAVTNTVFGAISSVAFQPIPKMLSEATQKHGGNIMDMGSDGHRIVLEYNYSYLTGLQNNEYLIDATMKKLVGTTRHVIMDFIDQKKVPNIGMPLFANDAYQSQDVWGRFKERDFMAQVKKSADPHQMFSSRTVNWKL